MAWSVLNYKSKNAYVLNTEDTKVKMLMQREFACGKNCVFYNNGSSFYDLNRSKR